MPAPTSDREMQNRLNALSAGLRESGICVLHQDSDHRFDLVENPPASWPRQSMIGLREADILPAAIAADFAAAHERCRRDASEERRSPSSWAKACAAVISTSACWQTKPALPPS